jgi:hypothetical protein
MKREEEIEHQIGDEVSRLVSGLKDVTAPQNFDLAVMTRIAKGTPVSRRIFGLSPALGYALPIVLIAVVGIAIFVATRRTAAPQPEVADAGTSKFSGNQPPAPPVEAPSVEPSTVAANPRIQNKVPSTVEPPPRANATRRKQTIPPGGGSTDEALGEKRPVATIPNAQHPPVLGNRDEVISNNSVPVRDMLSQLGITADFNGGWVVRHVTANSPAERSGLKAGDIVIALGDIALNVNTEFKGQFSASQIRVRRNGQELELALK